MKFAIFVVLACFGIYFVSPLSISHMGIAGTRTLGNRSVFIPATPSESKTYNVTFPDVSQKSSLNGIYVWLLLELLHFFQPEYFHDDPIRGITHYDYEDDTAWKIVKGSLGEDDHFATTHVTVQLTSKPGKPINSKLKFWVSLWKDNSTQITTN